MSERKANLIEALPHTIESPTGKLIYLYVATTQQTSLDDLKTKLNMPRISLISVLQTLEDKNLICRDGDTITVEKSHE